MKLNAPRKSKLKGLVESVTNTRIYHNFLPTGVEMSYDFTKGLKNLKVDTIFDVGANIGQSAEKFIGDYPDSKIYCFEPVTSTYNILNSKFKDIQQVCCYKFAFGAMSKISNIIMGGTTNDCSYISDSIPRNSNFESIEVRTLDSFCEEAAISKIDFLKIDTEGNDLEVLKGAERMLLTHAIGAIQVEASMNSKNKLHVPFEVFKSLFESKGYYLFKIYDQVQEDNSPIQRRSNPVFISDKLF
jgi:FkbM family methyltransferase